MTAVQAECSLTVITSVLASTEKHVIIFDQTMSGTRADSGYPSSVNHA